MRDSELRKLLKEAAGPTLLSLGLRARLEEVVEDEVGRKERGGVGAPVSSIAGASSYAGLIRLPRLHKAYESDQRTLWRRRAILGCRLPTARGLQSRNSTKPG